MKRTLIVLALLVTFAGVAFAQTPSPSPRKAPALGPDAAATHGITVGTAVPSGQTFVITLDDASIDWAYPVWARPLPGAWTPTVTKEQFRAVVRDVVSRKLAATFPNGFPTDAAAPKMGLEIRIKLSTSSEIDVTIGC